MITPRPKWELELRIHCVNFYCKTGSFKKTHDSFMHQFECEKASSKSRIQNWVNHSEKHGTVENLNAASETCRSVLINDIRAYPYII